MAISRREFLKRSGVGISGMVAAVTAQSAAAEDASAENSAAMLYDATLCVGCRACQAACKKRADLPPETDHQGLYEMPLDLSAYTWTMIKLYQERADYSFVKNQCMHCVHPACVSVCPVSALEKLDSGPVIYHGERCIGCRYCMAACPFGIPKSQWDKNLPLIQKCDFCADLQAQGQPPACGEVCPTGALIYGKRGSLLDEARARLDGSEGYFPHVYGEHEVGGTSMLYIAGVDYQKLGFPTLDSRALSDITWPYMKAVPWVVATVITLSTAIYLRTHRDERSQPKTEAGNGH